MDQQPLSHIDPMSGRDPHFAQCSAVTVLELLIILSLNCVLSTALVNVFALKKKISGSGLGILKRGIIMFPKIGVWGGSEGQGELISAIE